MHMQRTIYPDLLLDLIFATLGSLESMGVILLATDSDLNNGTPGITLYL